MDLVAQLAGADDLGVLYAINTNSELIEIDPATGAVLATHATGLTAIAGGGLAYHNGELLAAPMSGETATAYRIDPASGTVLGEIDLGGYVILNGAYADVLGLAGDVTHTTAGVRRFSLAWAGFNPPKVSPERVAKPRGYMVLIVSVPKGMM